MTHNIVQYCASEVERQHASVQHVVHMYDGFMMVKALRLAYPFPTIDLVIQTHGLVEPDCRGGYRKSAVSFINGGTAARSDEIPRRMVQLFSIAHVALAPDDPVDNDYISLVDEFIKSFLDIHPFEDGNGRVASIMRNWILRYWDSPEMLPFYYG